MTVTDREELSRRRMAATFRKQIETFVMCEMAEADRHTVEQILLLLIRFANGERAAFPVRGDNFRTLPGDMGPVSDRPD